MSETPQHIQLASAVSVPREELAELYLQDNLSDSDREIYEEHYFGCDACFEELQTLRIVRDQFRAGKVKSRSTVGWWLAAAAAVVVAVLITPRLLGLLSRQTTSTTASVPDYPKLAMVRTPTYDPPLLRGSQTPAEVRFAQAMLPYKNHDYGAAIASLKTIVESDPQSASAQFYLGASYLLSDQPAPAAAAAFQAVIAKGPHAFVDEARFLLAQTFLKQGLAASARSELQQLASGSDEFAGEAQRQLKAIADLEKNR